MSAPEGYIQFCCEWKQIPAFDEQKIKEVALCRDACFDLGVVGISDDGIGFGNVSIRHENTPGFIITGTQTGHISQLDGDHFCYIYTFDVSHNKVCCKGPMRPSSEALTHAAVYSAIPEVAMVVHGHNRDIWEHFYNELPGTSVTAGNGSTQLALEVAEIARENKAYFPQGIVLRGHQDGFLVYGNSGEEITRYISDLLDAV